MMSDIHLSWMHLNMFFFQKKYDFWLSVWFSKPIIIKKYIKIFFCAVIPVLPSYKLDQFEVYNIILSFITRIFVTFISLSRRMVMLLQYSQTFFFCFYFFHKCTLWSFLQHTRTVQFTVNCTWQIKTLKSHTV